MTIVLMVGATGFEPATPWSQTMCATELRYAPMFSIVVDCGWQCKRAWREKRFGEGTPENAKEKKKDDLAVVLFS